MATTIEFNVPAGETIAREQLISYLNVGDSYESPVWSVMGSRVTESTAAYDWQKETSKDIVGVTRAYVKKPIVEQPFNDWVISNGDAAQLKIYQLAFIEQNSQALSHMDILIGHWHVTDKETRIPAFAERYAECLIEATGLGGDGGDNLKMEVNVTYAGERTVGNISNAGGVITFTPESED